MDVGTILEEVDLVPEEEEMVLETLNLPHHHNLLEMTTWIWAMALAPQAADGSVSGYCCSPFENLIQSRLRLKKTPKRSMPGFPRRRLRAVGLFVYLPQVLHLHPEEQEDHLTSVTLKCLGRVMEIHAVVHLDDRHRPALEASLGSSIHRSSVVNAVLSMQDVPGGGASPVSPGVVLRVHQP